MTFDLSIFFTYVGVVILIFVFGKLLLFPLKIILRVVLNSILGGIFLVVLNFVGENFDFTGTPIENSLADLWSI